MGITRAKRVRALPRANRSGIPPSNVGLTVRDKSWGEGLELQEPRPSSGYAPLYSSACRPCAESGHRQESTSPVRSV